MYDRITAYGKPRSTRIYSIKTNNEVSIDKTSKYSAINTSPSYVGVLSLKSSICYNIGLEIAIAIRRK